MFVFLIKGDHKKHVGQAWKPPQAKASMAKDIYLYLPLSAAKAAQDVVVHQHQLFLPFKHPGKVQVPSNRVLHANVFFFLSDCVRTAD